MFLNSVFQRRVVAKPNIDENLPKRRAVDAEVRNPPLKHHGRSDIVRSSFKTILCDPTPRGPPININSFESGFANNNMKMENISNSISSGNSISSSRGNRKAANPEIIPLVSWSLCMLCMCYASVFFLVLSGSYTCCSLLQREN